MLHLRMQDELLWWQPDQTWYQWFHEEIVQQHTIQQGFHHAHPLQDDTTLDDAEAKNHFWSVTGDVIYPHHVEPRVKLYVPREESFPIRMKYIDVTRTTYTSLDVLLEKQIEDYWNVDGERELSDAWTGCTRFVLLKEKATRRIHMVWVGDLQGQQTTSRPDDVWPDVEIHVRCREKEKQKWSIEKPKLDNARHLRGRFSIEPNDEQFKRTMTAARGKLEVPMPAAMPCKIPIKSSGARHHTIGKRKTKYACVVDADESTRPRLEGAGHKPHQDHIAAKGMNSVTQMSLVHKFTPMPQAFHKIQLHRRQWRKVVKTEQNSGMAADENQKQETGDRWSKD